MASCLFQHCGPALGEAALDAVEQQRGLLLLPSMRQPYLHYNDQAHRGFAKPHLAPGFEAVIGPLVGEDRASF
ncbi:hypothetical protein [Dyella silvatica]|uniref:hypothetical protein n=1 Tax=Dyella silvatica TaxID=2992128 RepID=UPI00224DA5F6|nr:hypothetical protein [Dyella silvatica]